jgi:chromosomal replication initiator protein
VRDLEGAFNTLIAYCDMLGKPMTLEVAKKQLKDYFSAPKQANVSLDNIIRVVADYFSLSISDIKGKKRHRGIVLPRQLAMYIARELTEYSTTEVGQAFGRDHTTVMHSYRQVEDMLRTNPTLSTNINSIIQMVREYAAK